VAAELEHYRIGGFDWRALRGFRPAVEALCGALEDPGRLEDSALVKASAARSVWRATLGGRAVYVKRYRVRGWPERLKYRFAPPRAEAEWRAARSLAAAGIEAAQPLAVGVARRGGWLVDAFFVAAEVPGVPHTELLVALREGGGGVDALLRATVDLYDRLCAAGFFHPDLHGGNMLARLEDAVPRIALVDLHSIRPRRRIGRRMRARMRAKLAHSLWRVLQDGEFARAVDLLAPRDAAQLRRQVDRLERIRLRSRSRRCVLPSTRFARERANGWKIWRRREVPRDALLALAAMPEREECRSARLDVGEGEREVTVRRRARCGWLPIWKGCHALGVRGIPTWQAYACLQRRRLGLLRDALLVLEHIPDAVRLDGDDPSLRDAALQRAALDTAERLHRVGLPARARDLFAVREGAGWRVLHRAFAGSIPDRPLAADRARRERDALRAQLAPDQSEIAQR
jgi:hypothetical protein